MVAPGDAFQHYFWGENNAGYDVLLTNMKQGVSAAKEFHDILRERANYEEAFSKSLRRLSDKTTSVSAVGTFLPIWEVIKKYIDSMSKIHSDYSTKIRELCSEIGTYKTEATTKAGKLIKEQNVVVKTSAVLSKVRNSLDHVDKCKRTYQQRHKELVESEEMVGKATEKELERAQQKHTKCQEAFTVAETTYKTSVEKYNRLQEEYNTDMVESCKFFGTVEQEHLGKVVEFARRYGDIETDLADELKRNCENVLGGDIDEGLKGIIGYTPEVLIELFVEDKKTGVEMVGPLETELLTIRDAPVPSGKNLEKSSDSGSVNSLPAAAHNTTTATTASGGATAPGIPGGTNLNTMTLAMSNVSMKAFRKMLKGSRANKKKKNEPDSKSLDSARTGDADENGTDDVSERDSEQGSVDHRPSSEIDFFDQKNSPFSSDDDMVDFGSDEDGTTAKVKTIKIRNPVDNAHTTEEELRKATESLTLRCLSPATTHRDRAKTVNPQLFSGHSSSLVDLPVSPEPTVRPFPTTFDTPRAKSVSGNLSSPRSTPRKFPEAAASDAWAVFDDRPKRASEGNALDLPPWSTPPAVRAATPSTATESLLDLGPMEPLNNIPPGDQLGQRRDIEELLSITVDESHNTSTPSDYMTPEGSPTNVEPDASVDGEEEEEEEEGRESEESTGKRKRLGSLIEFSPVRLGNPGEEAEITEVGTPVDPLSSTQRSDDESHIVDSGVEVDTQSPSVSLSNDIDVEDSKLLSPLSPGKDEKRDLLAIDSTSTENVEFSSQTSETAEDARPVYPIAIAVIETVNAVFKPDEECCSKVEGQLIMSLPCEAAATLATEPEPPSLKLKLSASTPPSAFIVNRQVISTKAPSLCEVHEVNMALLQDFLRRRLTETAGAPRINIPLLKYTCPVSKTHLAPLLTTSYWTCSGTDTILSMDVTVNETLHEQNFYFPRIVYASSLSESVTVTESEPGVDHTGNVLSWERLDVGNEVVTAPEHFQATFTRAEGEGGCTPVPTHVDFEMEGVAMSGLEVELETSEWYTVTTTVKKIRSGRYWTEPKVVDSNC